MRTAGWTAWVLGFVLAALKVALKLSDIYSLAAVGILFALGLLLLTIDAMIRLKRGQLVIRPWDATKSASRTFLIIVAIRLFVGYLLPSSMPDVALALIQSASFAIVFGLYQTAYRAPA